jgi:2-methylcitrate dehydratase PrpD
MGDREQVGEVGSDLGIVWRSLDVTYKPYAVCAILQEPVRQAMELARDNALAPGDITAVRLTLNPAEAAYPGTDSGGPFHDTGATLMSAQFCLAVGLSRQSIKGVDLTRFADPQILSLVRKASVHADKQLGARSFVLEVDLSQGKTLRHTSHATAEPFNWDRNGVVGNLRAMADEMPINDEALERLCTTVLAAEQHTVAEIVSTCIMAESP